MAARAVAAVATKKSGACGRFGIPASDRFAAVGWERFRRCAPEFFDAAPVGAFLSLVAPEHACDTCSKQAKHLWYGLSGSAPVVRFHCSAACISGDLFNNEYKPHPRPVEAVIETKRLDTPEKIMRLRELVPVGMKPQERQAIRHFFTQLSVHRLGQGPVKAAAKKAAPRSGSEAASDSR